MKKTASLIPLVGGMWFSLYAYEYVYPIAHVMNNDEDSILALYQKSPEHTEVWFYDPMTKEAERALLSSFTPVGISLLPDNKGFSFFDNGRLRIKHFLKRSPKAIDIYEPIYDIGQIQWVTDTTCLFHAKERERFSLYFLNTYDGSIARLISKETYDCLYPQVINHKLWYLTRKIDDQDFFTLESANLKESGDGKVYCEESRILLSHNKALAFLTMVDTGKGFVIEHSHTIDTKTETVLHCTCYQIEPSDQEEIWVREELFSFDIPLFFLLPDSRDRLSESLYPLIPRIFHGGIYYVSSVNGQMLPFLYKQGKKTCLVSAEEKTFFFHFFPPFDYCGAPILGGALIPEKHDTCEAVECLLPLTQFR